jgi:hypothetical protein
VSAPDNCPVTRHGPSDMSWRLHDLVYCVGQHTQMRQNKARKTLPPSSPRVLIRLGPEGCVCLRQAVLCVPYQLTTTHAAGTRRATTFPIPGTGIET